MQNPILADVDVGDMKCKSVFARLGDDSTVLMVDKAKTGPFIAIANRAPGDALRVTEGAACVIQFTNKEAIDKMRLMLDKAEKMLQKPSLTVLTDEAYLAKLEKVLPLLASEELDYVGAVMGISRVMASSEADAHKTIESLNDKGFQVYVNVGPARFPYEIGDKGYTLNDLIFIDNTFPSFSVYEAWWADNVSNRAGA